MSNRIPNSEQLQAIDHDGGKILSAGAGSGKTFVLIEHIVKKLKDFKNSTPKNEWTQKLPFYLSRIVLMTFTNKAAGEMSIRMLGRVEELCEKEEGDELEFWATVRGSLSFLNITTISSFCSKLISEGYFLNIPSNVEILSDLEFQNKIAKIFEEWFEKNKEELGQIFEANSKQMINGMTEVFKMPEMRMRWDEPFRKLNPEDEIDMYFDYILEELNFSDSYFQGVDLSNDEKQKANQWYSYVVEFNKLTASVGKLSAKNYRDYINWINNLKRAPAAPKAISDEAKEGLSLIKNLVKELENTADDIDGVLNNYDVYCSWVMTYKNLYNYIREHYFDEPGFTFADLEYFTNIGLKNEEVKNKIVKRYDYFIVDEFQDTSEVQYEIIKNLIDQNKDRLFCVGDRKQAIYGFRGGELEVFSRCIEFLGDSNNLQLKNNFRSKNNIINFNNNFFQKIFPLGREFKGKDLSSVLMETQSAPNLDINEGCVEVINANIVGLENKKVLNLDRYESELIFQNILELNKREDINTICVLYKKLRPAHYLIDLLAGKKIPFKAQVKIKYDEDPILNLFLRAIELKLNQQDLERLRSTHILMGLALATLNVKLSTEQIKKIEQVFIGDLKVLGLRLAFHKLVYSLGLSNSEYKNNSKFIDSICKIADENLVDVYQMLNNETDGNYSFELINGIGLKKIIIMTAHASKGLEFDAVLLGGIYTNGDDTGKRENIGKMPKSFKWKKAYNQKSFLKSPAYIIEGKSDKLKDFSESKRLLYVACTRAVKYLSWIDLEAEIDGKREQLVSGKNHWILGMRILESNEVDIVKHVEVQAKNEDKILNIPIMQKDSLGVLANDKNSRLGIVAEASVTKLAILADCTFKFYLANICKISPPSSMHSKPFEEKYEEVEEENEIFFSSKQRGTFLHEKISLLINNQISINDFPAEDREKIKWVMEEYQKIGLGKAAISEKMIKFSLFGQMISGTPDLVIENPEEIIVWDFKTGAREEHAEASYWMQLMCYAYAHAKLKQFTPEKKIPLSLIYVDQMKNITRVLSLEEISKFLFENWSKTELLYQANLEHCRYCEYSSICHYAKTSAH